MIVFQYAKMSIPSCFDLYSRLNISICIAAVSYFFSSIVFCYSILAIGCLFMSLVPVTKHGSQAMGNQNKSIVRLSSFFSPRYYIFIHRTNNYNINHGMLCISLFYWSKDKSKFLIRTRWKWKKNKYYMYIALR